MEEPSSYSSSDVRPLRRIASGPGSAYMSATCLFFGTAVIAYFAAYRARRSWRLARAATPLADMVDAARRREQAKLARDLHDGVLQDLAAVALQLKLTSDAAAEPLKSQISGIAAIIVSQQRRIRQFVESDGSREREMVPLGPTLFERARFASHQWNCRVDLSLHPPDLAVQRRLAEELIHLVSEATANAVRHGGATNLRVGLARTATTLTMKIADNGTGLRSGPDAKLPRSLEARVAELGGALSISREAPGLGLRITLPYAGAPR